ncbi:hypothetical protein B296_00044970 [Ensete ventricosum]|uniref:Uncharacterized protein n=1 Tax=Ensete ventricosum TaxID=4639 RepID=A0A426X3B7_ENSVE|nr:hypothetical protein B296_00044970 [Ensete ventricosum]
MLAMVLGTNSRVYSERTWQPHGTWRRLLRTRCSCAEAKPGTLPSTCSASARTLWRMRSSASRCRRHCQWRWQELFWSAWVSWACSPEAHRRRRMWMSLKKRRWKETEGGEDEEKVSCGLLLERAVVFFGG